jgi:hypothetical protein
VKSISINDSRAVFGKDEYTYQCVLDDFGNTKFIGIMTFNISPKADSHLLKSLKNACMNGTNAVVITNIPKRFPSYLKGANSHVLLEKMVFLRYWNRFSPSVFVRKTGNSLNRSCSYPQFIFVSPDRQIVVDSNEFAFLWSVFASVPARSFAIGTADMSVMVRTGKDFTMSRIIYAHSKTS